MVGAVVVFSDVVGTVIMVGVMVVIMVGVVVVLMAVVVTLIIGHHSFGIAGVWHSLRKKNHVLVHYWRTLKSSRDSISRHIAPISLVVSG
jgi:hypothetical protein